MRLDAEIARHWQPLAEQLRAIPPDRLSDARARYQSMALGDGAPDARVRGRFAVAAIDAMQASGVDPLETLAAIHRGRADAALKSGLLPITRETAG